MSEILLQQYGIFLIVAGLSLALLMALFLLMRRNAQKKRGLRPAALAIAQADDAGLLSPVTPDDMASDDMASDEGADEKAAEDVGGFQFFKRKKSEKNDKPSSGATTRLVDIEQEMLAIRELFRAGQISRSVYVAETKALYETARLVQK